MIKVTNISNKNISIDGISIKSFEFVVFPENIPETTRSRINALSNLKIISVAYVDETVTNKKSNRKSNK